jgi:hypothetical protein
MVERPKHLPVVQEGLEDDGAACSPSIYVSNEEATLLEAMRELRRRSSELKRRATEAADTDRVALESEIEELRDQWHDLAARREQAYIRKMIMLGHLPPEAETKL